MCVHKILRHIRYTTYTFIGYITRQIVGLKQLVYTTFPGKLKAVYIIITSHFTADWRPQVVRTFLTELKALNSIYALGLCNSDTQSELGSLLLKSN